MSLAIVYSRANAGIQAPLVSVEAHLSGGLPKFSIVGLPETVVKESKDRVRSAILNSQFEFPSHKITINLAPAELPKEGGRFDLPIAIGILAASGQIPKEALRGLEFAGELALSGELRSVAGMLPFVLATRQTPHAVILPQANVNDVAFVGQVPLLPAQHLVEVVAHLLNQQTLTPIIPQVLPPAASIYPDLADVYGQAAAKRALEIAAAGGHSLLMLGPPGTGKTMLASRLPGILPELTLDEALEVAALTSLNGGKIDQATLSTRPFRSPHHTASAVALVGGGSVPRPGEISLAHQGVLFLDELPEFNRHVLEVLREPLESGRICIARAASKMEFPAQFQLIAAMNPCPCGYLGDDRCRCTPDRITRYHAKLSGPLLDRIDMQIEVPMLSHDLLSQPQQPVEPSEHVRARTAQARMQQLRRQQRVNAALTSTQVTEVCQLSPASISLMQKVTEQWKLSARVYHRILRVARTIADLSGEANITCEHVSEAISYRRLERFKFQYK